MTRGLRAADSVKGHLRVAFSFSLEVFRFVPPETGELLWTMNNRCRVMAERFAENQTVHHS